MLAVNVVEGGTAAAAASVASVFADVVGSVDGVADGGEGSCCCARSELMPCHAMPCRTKEQGERGGGSVS